MTRATRATLLIAWMRPMNWEVSVIGCFSARTMPTATGPVGICAQATLSAGPQNGPASRAAITARRKRMVVAFT